MVKIKRGLKVGLEDKSSSRTYICCAVCITEMTQSSQRDMKLFFVRMSMRTEVQMESAGFKRGQLL